MLSYAIFYTCKGTFPILIYRYLRGQVFNYKRIHKSHCPFEFLGFHKWHFSLFLFLRIIKIGCQCGNILIHQLFQTGMIGFSKQFAAHKYSWIIYCYCIHICSFL